MTEYNIPVMTGTRLSTNNHSVSFAFRLQDFGGWGHTRVRGRPFSSSERGLEFYQESHSSTHFFLVDEYTLAEKPDISYPELSDTLLTPGVNYNWLPIHGRNLGTVDIYKTTDGEEEQEFFVYSELAPEIVKKFLTANTVVVESSFGHYARQLDIMSWEETGPRTRIAKYSDLLERKVVLDKYGTVSMLGEDKFNELLSFANSQEEKVPVIRIKNKLVRGDDGLELEIINLSPAQLKNDTNCLVPYLAKKRIFDLHTGKIIDAYLFCFASQICLQKLKKYKKTQKLFTQLLHRFESDSEAILNPEGWVDKIGELNKKYYSYWDGFSKLTQTPHKSGIFSTISDDNRFKTKINSNELKNTVIQRRIKTSSEYSNYEKIKNRFDEVTKNEEVKRQEYTDLKSSVDWLTEEVLRVERKLLQKKEELQQKETSASRILETINSINEGTAEFKEEFNKTKESIKLFIAEKLSESEGDASEEAAKLIENLYETGIVITDIETEELESIGDGSVFNQDGTFSQITRICFKTLKPLIIKVDAAEHGEDCPKVVGGPYAVEVTESSINVRLASLDACFGYSDGRGGTMRIWSHPHTPYYVVTKNKETYSALDFPWRNGCLGEVSPALYAAFKNNNPMHIVFAAMTWLTSANSADEWGKHWRRFPRLSKVTLDAEVEIEELPVSSEISAPDENQGEVSETPGNVVDLGHVGDLEGWHGVPEEAEPETEDHQEAQRFAWRTAGNPNYTPYY